jgi:hypothetical protein
MRYLKQEIEAFVSSNIPENTEVWSNEQVAAGSFTVGKTYTILYVGTTNFTLIGASSNTIGTVFTATGVGSGTGTAMITYVAGDLLLLEPYIYKAVAINSDKRPDIYTGVYWVKWSVSNRLAMLDLSANSQSEVIGADLVVVFNQVGIETLAIGNYEASGIKVEVLTADELTVLWTYENKDFYNIAVDDYYSYIYEPYDFAVSRGIKIDIPVLGSKIRVTLYSSGIRAACGFLAGGLSVYMGETLWGVGFKYNSFAIKSTDDFGTLSVTKRAVQDLVDFETVFDSTYLMRIRQNIKSIYNDIIVFIVEDDSNNYENLLTLGVVESASIVLSNSQKTTMTWSIVEAI